MARVNDGALIEDDRLYTKLHSSVREMIDELKNHPEVNEVVMSRSQFVWLLGRVLGLPEKEE